MVWKNVRDVLVVCSLAAVVAFPLRADDAPKADAPKPDAPKADAPPPPGPGPVAPAPLAAPAHEPCYATVCCTEWVQEKVPCTRTCYKTVCKEEVYTAYKTECYPVVQTRTCTVCKMVPEMQTHHRNVCTCVPYVEERTKVVTHVSYKPVVKMVKKCEDHGHWECHEVCCPPSFCERLKAKLHHCEPCCTVKLEKCWVPCRVWVECPVTVCEPVCTSYPVTYKVTCYKTVVSQEAYQVCVYKSIPETRVENYTVMVPKLVPFQATRTVAVCVPYQETYWVTRCVPHTVVKKVPVETCCPSPCCH
jgi:hypothetical protein